MSGVSETAATGKATLHFSTPVKDKNVQVFAVDNRNNAVLMQNAYPVPGSVTEYNFVSNGLHNYTLVVRADTTNCRGSFTLGSEKENDEQFIS